MSTRRVGAGVSRRYLMLLGICFGIVGLGGLVAYFGEHLDTGLGPYSLPGSRKPTDPGPMMEMGPFTVNLTDSEPPRFMRTTIIVEFDKADSLDEAKTRASAVSSAITAALAATSYQAARSYTGKSAMRTKLVDEMNRTLPNQGVRAVYFRDLIME